MEGWGTPGGLISMSPKANFWWLRKSAIKLLKRPSWTSWIPKKWLWIQKKLKKHLEKSHRGTDVYFFPSFIPFHSFIQNWEESPQPLVFGSLYNQPAKWIFLSSGGPRGTFYSQLTSLFLVTQNFFILKETPYVSGGESPGLAESSFAEVCTWWEGTQHYTSAEEESSGVGRKAGTDHIP